MDTYRSIRLLNPAVLAIAAILVGGRPLFGQKPAGAGTSSTKPLPDSPEANDKGVMASSIQATGTFIGYMSNKSLIFPDIAHSPGPLSTGGKFKLFVNQSISPPYILAAATSAGISQARDDPSAMARLGCVWKRFGQPWRGLSNSFFSSLLSSALRYCAFHRAIPPLGKRQIFTAGVRTRTDSGRDTINLRD
jgi:hypothetical protein